MSNTLTPRAAFDNLKKVSQDREEKWTYYAVMIASWASLEVALDQLERLQAERPVLLGKIAALDAAVSQLKSELAEAKERIEVLDLVIGESRDVKAEPAKIDRRSLKKKKAS